MGESILSRDFFPNKIEPDDRVITPTEKTEEGRLKKEGRFNERTEKKN